MALFGVLGTSASGLHLYRTWLDAVGDNIANINTARPTSEEAFRERFLVAEAPGGELGSGVRISGLLFGDPEGRLVHQPDHPLADEDGMIRMPDMDLGDQMSQLLLAQRGYQANLAVIERARDAYAQALGLGK